MAGWNSILHTPEYPRSATATPPRGTEIGVIKCCATKGFYRVARAVAHMTQGAVSVRHGSQVNLTTQAELLALEAEGELLPLRPLGTYSW
jgi:hypothetical protein